MTMDPTVSAYVGLPGNPYDGSIGTPPYGVSGRFAMTAAQVAALKAAGTPVAPGTIIIDPSSPYSVLGVVDGSGNLSDPPQKKGSILTATGTYTGTGSAQTITLGWKPTLVIVKAATNVASARIGGGDWWYGKTATASATAHVASGVFIEATGFSVGTDASVSTNAVTYHYIAIKDNESNSVMTADYAGNGVAGRVVDLFRGKEVAAAYIKRDNTFQPVIAARGLTGYYMDGTGSVTASLDAAGDITVGSEDSVNQWAGDAGESTSVVGFTNNQNISVGTYVGNGSAGRVVPFAFEPDALLIFPRASTSTSATLWTSSLATGDHLPMEAAAMTSGRITSVVGSRMIVSADAAINQNSREYLLIAIRRNRNGSFTSPAWPLDRPQRAQKNIWIDATGYITFGTSDLLNIVGPLTMEWYGVHFNTNITAMSPGGATTNDQAFQMPMMWRQNGADGAASNVVSWGMGVFSPSAGTSSSSRDAGLWVAVTSRFDLMQGAGFDVDANQPWQTGVPLTPRQPAHVMVTHDGSGVWRVYLNGQLVKERKRDLTAVGQPNGGNISGATTSVNGRKRGTASIDHTTFTQVFTLARIYDRELSREECRRNFDSLFLDSVARPAADFVEEWDAANTSGATLVATNNSANNGTLVNARLMGI